MKLDVELNDLFKFIEENGKNHLCSEYENVDEKVIKAMFDVYRYSLRFFLFKPQIIAMLDNVIRPFLDNKTVSMYERRIYESIYKRFY